MQNFHFRDLINFDGLPPTTEYSGKSLQSTVPIAIIVPVLICLPGVILVNAPIQQSSSTIKGLLGLIPWYMIGLLVS